MSRVTCGGYKWVYFKDHNIEIEIHKPIKIKSGNSGLLKQKSLVGYYEWAIKHIHTRDKWFVENIHTSCGDKKP